MTTNELVKFWTSEPVEQLLAEAYQQPQTIERHKQIANILRYYHAQKKARQRL